MTTYEIFGYFSAREQPIFDTEPVMAASMDDLDEDRIRAHIDRLRRERPGAGFLRQPTDHVARHLGLSKPIDGIQRPTLAGMLAFGLYPQSIAPQLILTFLQFFGTTEDESTPRGERFVDKGKFEGTIDDIINDAVLHVLASIRKSSLIDGLFRRDIPEYPEIAIREAVINAVAHRDYSPMARGSHIQVRLFADRLEIQSPGGLHGPVTVDTIDDEQSSRNPVLVRILEDMHLVENRGSGIRAMIRAMRQANLEPPVFNDRRVSFQVTFRNHTLMDTETITWLNRFGGQPLNDHQRVALAYLRRQGRITNSEYRRLNHVDLMAATRDLRGLVQIGLLTKHGIGRGTFYQGSFVQSHTDPLTLLSPRERVLAYVQRHGLINNPTVRELLDFSSDRATTLLAGMTRDGALRREGTGRWTIYRRP